MKVHGVCRAGGGQAITPKTAFDLGSCSKSFVATAMVLLADQGKLKLDDPVRRYLPEFHLDEAWMDDEVTIRDLLCNRIGLRRQIPVESFANPEIDALDIIRRISKLDRLHPFREGYVYFNPGFMAARLIVERVSGQSYGDFLNSALFAPLGMRNSASGESLVNRLPERAAGHVVRDGQAIPLEIDAFDNWQGAAGVWSSAHDMSRWLEFLLEGGRYDRGELLKTDLLAETHLPHTDIPANECKLIHQPEDGAHTSYCLGWWTSSFHGRRLVQHAGEMIGWRAQVALLPEEKVAVAVMLSASVPLHAVIAYTVLETLLEGKSRDWQKVAKAREFRQAEDMDQAMKNAFPGDDTPGLPLEAYSGSYSHPALGTLHIDKDGHRLIVQFEEGRIWTTALEHLGGHVFSMRLLDISVTDYMPAPLRARFDVENGHVISLTDANASYRREGG